MKVQSGIRIVELSRDDLAEIVKVHVASFPHSASTRLGEEAVRRYYEWQFLAPHDAHFLGGSINDQLEGFCICGTFRGAFAGFVARNRWFLARQVLFQPGLWRHQEVRAAARTAFRRFVHPPARVDPVGAAPSKRFGILSIAVSPRCRGLGVGGQLMHAAEQAARESGFTVMGLTVHPTNVTAVRFYEKLGWVRVTSSNLWSGRMEKIIGLASDAISRE